MSNEHDAQKGWEENTHTNTAIPPVATFSFPQKKKLDPSALKDLRLRIFAGNLLEKSRASVFSMESPLYSQFISSLGVVTWKKFSRHRYCLC